ncbi:MAG: CHASE2 domain-containing protein [Actinomycetota bacterium]
MNRRRLARRVLAAGVLAGIAAGVAALLLGNGFFAGFQERSVDRFFPSARTDPGVVVVGMDEPSLIRFGAPPWPRSVHARLARQLAAAGAAVVVWDVAFYSSSENSPVRPNQAAETADFADALRTLNQSGAVSILGVDGNLDRRADDRGLQTIDPTYPPTPALDGAATTTAHVIVSTADDDGVVRRVPLVVETTDGRFVPSLSLAAVLAARQAQAQPVVRADGVQAGGRFVPTEGAAEMRINFARGLDGSPGRQSVVSARDVYDGTVDPKRFAGKIVFIGATAESARDNFDVPIDKSRGLPGVLIHANAANTMLTASTLEVASNASVVFVIALLCFLVALAVLFLPVWLSPLVAFGLGVVYLFAVAYQFDHGRILDLVYPYGMMVITFAAAFMFRYFTETRHRRRVSRLFAQYVPATVAQQLVDEGRAEQAAEGERLDVSLFFCDVRGFTATSAALTPQQVRVMLNEFYDALTNITLDHNGTVLKFVGDEVFAVFGAPLPVEHHPQVALECVMAIQRHTPILNEKLAEMGIPPVHLGIGMNTGEVVAAHVGGGKRRQYDVVGDTVNIGSRMCGQAGSGDIVMPVAMYQALDEPPPAESMGPVALKNVDAPMELVRIRVDWPDGVPTDGDRIRGRTTPSAATMGT